ncbi:hypothetical protein [Candidatus Agathobaculum pullicola]|uniref:hypothetical protein n=1 Tax=Candidatus Agathobaculum pullicola TaxID=2838426 RepID=UPI003F8E69AB
MQLQEMARQYRSNTALLELRLKQLQVAQRRAEQNEVKYRLKQRINCLQVMINENRKTAFVLEHYYDRGGEAHENGKAV